MKRQVDAKVNGNASEIAKSDEIQPYSKNVEFEFKATKQAAWNTIVSIILE